MKTRQSKSKTGRPAQKFLALIRRHLTAIRKDVSKLISMGEAMGEALLAGGNIFTPPVSKFWPHEFGSRAGGLMGIKGDPAKAKDIGFFALPDPRKWDPAADETLQKLLKGKARLFVNGRPEDLGKLARDKHFAGFTGGAHPDDGLYSYDGIEPLASIRPFEQFVRGWIVTGEMICRCIRGGKMPIIWMSVWMEGAMARNAAFAYNDMMNLREPSYQPPTVPLEVFHKNRYIPPLPAGYAAELFLGNTEKLIEALESQLDRLAQAGRWLAQAKRSGRRIKAVLTGHSYPAILELPENDTHYPLIPGRPDSMLLMATPPDFKKGDILLHLGYGPPQNDDIQKIVKRGIKLIHTSPYGLPNQVKPHPNFLWFDLPWPPGDALVPIPGYSVPILPTSSTAHSIAYPAILCEWAERMSWR